MVMVRGLGGTRGRSYKGRPPLQTCVAAWAFRGCQGHIDAGVVKMSRVRSLVVTVLMWTKKTQSRGVQGVRGERDKGVPVEFTAVSKVRHQLRIEYG